jgi:ribosome-associated protein
MESLQRSMLANAMIFITSRLSIPRRELQWRYSTSGGPGGQHANKVATRVTLLFDIQNSDLLTETQKKRIINHFPTRINASGILRVVSSKHRSQRTNKETAIERFAILMAEALKYRKKRKKSSIPFKSKRRRLEQKRKRADLKHQRGRVNLGEHCG